MPGPVEDIDTTVAGHGKAAADRVERDPDVDAAAEATRALHRSRGVRDVIDDAEAAAEGSDGEQPIVGREE